MIGCILLCLAGAQATPIGSGLRDGSRLVYQSGGVDQAPWVYDSVRVMEHDGFERCVRTFRTDQPVRQSCVRGDTLFDGSDTGGPRPARPVGPNMRMEVRTASGDVVLYETGEAASRTVERDLQIAYLPTTITTRNAAGVPTRRLREQYAPALLTALWGAFEEPDGEGGWKTVREFWLREVQR